jgi:hypothetical protein
MYMIVAALLVLGINVEIDLGGLFKAHKQRAPQAACGIRVVGYHFTGQPGQRFEYAGEMFTIPRQGYVELISEPRVKSYSFEGKKLLLDSGDASLDVFSFRWIALPSSTIEGGNRNE